MFEPSARFDVLILESSRQKEVDRCNNERDKCDVVRQRVCSRRVGYTKYQPMQCKPPKMKPKGAKTTWDQRPLFVMGA